MTNVTEEYPVVSVNGLNTLSSESERARTEFLALQPLECLEVWKSLPAPSFIDVDGEYGRNFLPNYNETYKHFVGIGLDNEENPNGYWVGKAWKPFGQVTGEGYNIWRMPDGRIERRVRFGTHIGTSRIDGRLSLVMTYASFNRTADAGGYGTAWHSDTIDEMRELAPGVLVGCATLKMQALLDARHELMRSVHESYGIHPAPSPAPTDRTDPLPAMFVLSGPAGPWQGVDDPMAEDV